MKASNKNDVNFTIYINVRIRWLTSRLLLSFFQVGHLLSPVGIVDKEKWPSSPDWSVRGEKA